MLSLPLKFGEHAVSDINRKSCLQLISSQGSGPCGTAQDPKDESYGPMKRLS